MHLVFALGLFAQGNQFVPGFEQLKELLRQSFGVADGSPPSPIQEQLVEVPR